MLVKSNWMFTFLLSASSVFLSQIEASPLIDAAQEFVQMGSEPFQQPALQLLDELRSLSMAFRVGSDAEQRPVFVNAQADFERAIVHCLRTGAIVQSVCVIHTPAPATPLCTNGEISLGLIDPKMLRDPQRFLTVKKRPAIIRDYLQEAGTLLTVYPKGGRKWRTEEQLAILDQLIEKYPDHLKAIELDCTEIPPEMSGATYWLTCADGQTYILSFRSYQANVPTDGQWAIWFGSIHDPVVARRLQEVKSFLRSTGLELE